VGQLGSLPSATILTSQTIETTIEYYDAAVDSIVQFLSPALSFLWELSCLVSGFVAVAEVHFPVVTQHKCLRAAPL
jgi:hypothetical protein